MIAYDLQAGQRVAHGERGIARFVGDLARALEREHPGLVDRYLWNDALPRVDRLDALGVGDKLRSFSEVRGEVVDVLHLNSPFELIDIGEFVPPVRARRSVVTCFDLIPYRFPDRYLTDPSVRARYTSRLPMLVAADAVVTDSTSAADDVHRLLGVPEDRLTVIGAGVADVFVPPTDTHAARLAALRSELPDLDDGYVLVPTGMDWRKNTEGAVAAYAALPREVRDAHPLVLACRVDDHQRAELQALADRLGIADRMIVTGYTSDHTLVRLYQTAELVLFPSKYEGFGLPVLEARRCGARVICSDASSLPEVLTERRARFNPWVPEEITLALYRALTDDHFRTMLDRVPDPDLDWSIAADRLARVYERIRPAAAPPAPDVVRPRRLAIASPLPPTPSGIAAHSDRLLRAMCEMDGVRPTAFVARDASGLEDVVPYPVHDLSGLPVRWALGEFDAVLYCFGNHEFHRPYLPMLRLVPGAVFLHDVRLAGVYAPERPVRGQSELGAAPIARAATRVLVQSRHAADLLLADSGIAAIDVGPLHCASVGAERIATAGERWVVSAGIADASKRTDVFVAAARQLAGRPGVRTAVVGLGGEAFVGPEDPVEATGPVSDAEFDAWLRRAAVLVQLRGSSNGESSGVIADALARGCVVVASRLGAMAELPDDVVVKVDADVGPEELAAVVAALLDDDERRAALSARARAYAAEQTPSAQARRILDALFP